MLWASPARFNRCESLIRVLMACTRAVLQLIDRVSHRCWSRVFFMGIRNKLVGVACRTVWI